MKETKKNKNAWFWVPSLYFTEGLPYVIIITVSVVMYKKLGLSNADIGLYTSWFYLPWVIKPLWSPLVDIKSTKRRWFLAMQLLITFAFLAIGFVLPTNSFLILSLAFFWMAAFASATHDIAADGYYLMGLTQDKQSFFIGVRSTFYRLAMITGQGLIVVFAGFMEEHYSNPQNAWSVTMMVTAGLMLLVTCINMLTTSEVDEDVALEEKPSFIEVFTSFFQKKQIWMSIAFIFTYRLGESQLVKMAAPFLLDTPQEGGIGLSTSEHGLIYGTFGVIALLLGGILGGILISKDGLGKWMLPMILALNIPNAFYAVLAFTQPDSVILAAAVVILEQFGYGFGFTAFMMYLIYVAEGISKTAHYSIATGLMALGMMLPGMISGYIQEYLGYPFFFVWVLLAAIPAIILIKKVDFPYEYGKKATG
ncbi:MFS transporter [Ascidiimonas sp. W6]|uniref:MFS transporter n=1 Tax=Ascidiimonas meishanensis TaxID=3128903 RepID=UPI0030EF3B60